MSNILNSCVFFTELKKKLRLPDTCYKVTITLETDNCVKVVSESHAEDDITTIFDEYQLTKKEQ